MTRLAAILPHTKLYGGVKRFFELGEVFLSRGIDFKIFTPTGEQAAWYSGKVTTSRLSEISEFIFDAVFITETQFLPQLSSARARRKILYFVRPSDSLTVLRRYPEVEVFANSENGYEVAKLKYGIEAFKAFGGINTKTFNQKQLRPISTNEPVTVLTYGRIVEKKKGTMLVVKACEKLYRKGYKIKLLLFDTPVNEKAALAIKNFRADVPHEFVVNHPVEKNPELFHRGDIFVAAERKTGYSNTAAEAMASGLPVIATDSGTKHFLINRETGLLVKRSVDRIADAIEELLNDLTLRQKLGSNGRRFVESFSWEMLASKILAFLEQSKPENTVIRTSMIGSLKVFFKNI